MDSMVSVLNKNFTGNGKESAETLGAFENAESHLNWQFPRIRRACEELSWNNRTSTPHRSETNGIAERAVRIKEGTSAVLLQSGLDVKWRRDSMGWHCYLRNVADLFSDRKTHCEQRFGEKFEAPVFPFVSMIECHLFSGQNLSRTHQFDKIVCLEYFSDMFCTRGASRREALWSQTLRSWKTWTREKVTLSAKEVITPKIGDTCTYPDRRWKKWNYQEEIRFWEHPSQIGTTSKEAKNTKVFVENQTGLIHLIHFQMTVKPRTTFGLVVGIIFTVITSNQESNSMCRKKNPSQFHYGVSMWPTSTTLNELQERGINDCGNIDGERDLSEAWTGFTQFTKKNFPTGLHGAECGWRKRKLHRGQIICGHSESMGVANGVCDGVHLFVISTTCL